MFNIIKKRTVFSSSKLSSLFKYRKRRTTPRTSESRRGRVAPLHFSRLRRRAKLYSRSVLRTENRDRETRSRFPSRIAFHSCEYIITAIIIVVVKPKPFCVPRRSTRVHARSDRYKRGWIRHSIPRTDVYVARARVTGYSDPRSADPNRYVVAADFKGTSSGRRGAMACYRRAAVYIISSCRFRRTDEERMI